MDKTFWGTNCVTFLGLLLDSQHQVVCIPADKISRALEMIDSFMKKGVKKVTVLQVQKLDSSISYVDAFYPEEHS